MIHLRIHKRSCAAAQDDLVLAKGNRVDTGVSIWIILGLVALLFVVLWGMLFFFIAFGTWFISRSGGLSDDKPRRHDNDWEE